MVPLPFDADIGIELDPTIVPLPFDADIGIEFDAAPMPTIPTASREGPQTPNNETIEPEVTETSSTVDTDGHLEHTLLGIKPIAAAEDDFECHSLRADDFKNNAVRILLLF